MRSLWSRQRKPWSGLLSLLVVTPVVAFYLLVDWDRMIRHHRQTGSRRGNRATVRRLGREMDRAVAGFVRGQSAVCLFLAASSTRPASPSSASTSAR